MKRFSRARNYLPDPDRDLQEEIESHLELKVEELTGQGMSTEEVWTEALRALGDRERARIEASSHARIRLRRRSLLDQVDPPRTTKAPSPPLPAPEPISLPCSLG